MAAHVGYATDLARPAGGADTPVDHPHAADQPRRLAVEDQEPAVVRPGRRVPPSLRLELDRCGEGQLLKFQNLAIQFRGQFRFG